MKIPPGPELDRMLAEALSITPKITWVVRGVTECILYENHYEGLAKAWANAFAEDVRRNRATVQRREKFPELSQTGDGMLLVMERVKRRGWHITLNHSQIDQGSCWASIIAGSGVYSGAFDGHSSIGFPAAVAYAAAAALDINLDQPDPVDEAVRISGHPEIKEE